MTNYKTSFESAQAKDKRVKNTLRIAAGRINKWRFCNYEFCLYFLNKSATEVTWNDICAKVQELRCPKIAVYFMREMLDEHLYQGEFADLFYQHPYYFNDMFLSSSISIKLFCGSRIKDIIGVSAGSDVISVHDGYRFTDFEDPSVQDIFEQIMPKNLFTHDTLSVEFWHSFSAVTLQSVTWTWLCETAAKYKCPMAIIYFVNELLNRGLYHGEYEEALYARKSVFNTLCNGDDILNSAQILCGSQITSCYFLNRQRQKDYSFLFMDSKNGFFLTLVFGFYLDAKTYAQPFRRDSELWWKFEKSLGIYRESLSSVDQFTDRVFWEQIIAYRNFCSNDQDQYERALSLVLHFYRWLSDNYPDAHIFEHSLTMSSRLLFSKQIIPLIKKGYYFTALNYDSLPYGHRKIVFLIRDEDRHSTRLFNNDFFTMDLDLLTCKSYANLVMRYMATLPVASLAHKSRLSNLIKGLNLLTDYKMQTGYPNPNWNFCSNEESVILRTGIMHLDIQRTSRMNILGQTAQFFRWCKDNSLIQFGDLFFDNFTGYHPDSTESDAKAVPDDTLSKIITAMEDDSKTSQLAFMYLVITVLLIETKYRIGTICKLQVTSIRPTIKTDQFRLCGYSKTSGGRLDEYIIDDKLCRMLKNVINDTQKLRDTCNINGIHDYIFLIPGDTRNGTGVIRPESYSQYLKSVCKRIGVQSYTASNLRDTHMTKALEFAIKHNLSDFELSELTGHVMKKTTTSHYIDWNLEEMLEAVYDIDLTSVSDKELSDISAHIKPKIPEAFDNDAASVENGCGHCTAETCHIASDLPCLSCRDFVTTVSYLPAFERMAEHLDIKIQNDSNTQHDIDDLLVWKKLCVSYIQAIYQAIEDNKREA